MAIRIRKRLTKKEYIFNVISLITVIVIGLYFGIRSIYYYSDQNNSKKVLDKKLALRVINTNGLTRGANGLHQDKDGYYFKGKVENNYVKFANRSFRILRVNNDKTVKLISDNNAAIFMWGEKNKYKNSNLNNWLNKTNNKNSGVYYDTIPSIDKFLIKTKYSEDKLLGDKVKKSNKTNSDYIATISINDYVNAGGKNSYLNNGKYYWLIGHDKDKMNLYVNDNGEVEGGINSDSYGVRAVITMNKNVEVTTGDGTKNNPYIIEQNNNTNYIDQYVKIDNDLYKVSKDKNGILRLISNDYIKVNNVENKLPYSNNISLFSLLNINNIAYYLNNTYFNTLSYKDKLLDINNNIGEISDDTELNYSNIFKESISTKVGLVNMFDYNTSDLTDYYLINTTSSIGNMAYVYNKVGILEEAEVTEVKHIVPVIEISKNIVKKGKGTKDKPYIVE